MNFSSSIELMVAKNSPARVRATRGIGGWLHGLFNNLVTCRATQIRNSCYSRLNSYATSKTRIDVVAVLVSCFFIAANTVATAQSDNRRALPVIISFLLDDQAECPMVRPSTTVTLSGPITSQAELDALGGVTKVEGDLAIENLSLASPDFSPLASLVEVTGSVSFFGPSLSTIEGLGCLTTIGNNLDIIGNSSLVSVAEFAKLESVGGLFRINNNASMTSLTGFDALTTVESLLIDENDALTIIPAFTMLTSVGQDLRIRENAMLASFSGFANLGMVGGRLEIFNNQRLTDFADFTALSRVVDTLVVSNNPMLAGFSSFNNTQSVGGLEIAGNAILTATPSFDVLTSVTNSLVIEDNTLLAGVSGFSQLGSNDIGDGITVMNNSLLDCTSPVPNFSPVSESIGNLVDCATSAIVARSLSPNVALEDAFQTFDPINGFTITQGSLQSSIVIDDQSGEVGMVTVDLDITHTFVGDLTITLSNGTTEVMLIDQVMGDGDFCSANNISIRLDDSSADSVTTSCTGRGDLDEAFPLSVYAPMNALSGFIGDDVNGTWILTVTDSFTGDQGVLNSWGLNIEVPRNSQ